MAVAFIQEFPITDRSTSNYDAVNDRLTENQPAPEGLDPFRRIRRRGWCLSHRQRLGDTGAGAELLRQPRHAAVREVVGDPPSGTPPTRQGSYEPTTWPASGPGKPSASSVDDAQEVPGPASSS